MNFNYMTGICSNTSARAAQPQSTPAATDGFLDKLTEKSGGAEGVPRAGNISKAGWMPKSQSIPEAGWVSKSQGIPETGWMPKSQSIPEAGEISKAERAAMSMAEYKLYLYDKISSLPVHPLNMQDSVAVHISEEGLWAMKNDPEYEKWVLDCLRKNFQAYDPWSGRNGGKYVIFYFGASKEEHRVESWRPSYRDEERERLFRKKAKDSFWERRRKRRKALLAMYEELAEKKALSKRMAVSRYYAELAAQPPEAETLPPSECDALAMQIFSTFRANIILNMFRIKKF